MLRNSSWNVELSTICMKYRAFDNSWIGSCCLLAYVFLQFNISHSFFHVPLVHPRLLQHQNVSLGCLQRLPHAMALFPVWGVFETEIYCLKRRNISINCHTNFWHGGNVKTFGGILRGNIETNVDIAGRGVGIHTWAF